MRRRKNGKRPSPLRQFLFITALIVLASLALKLALAQGENQPQTRYIEIRARQWAFNPSVIEVNQGDTVVITLYTEDVSHGIYIEGYELRADLILGEGQPSSVTLRFVADKPGVFTFRCSVPCGYFHPFMTGKLIVKPVNPLNWSISLAIAVVAASFILFYIWRW